MNTSRVKPIWRVRYWKWITLCAGEWRCTGLMRKDVAEKIASSLRDTHERVEVYLDEYES